MTVPDKLGLLWSRYLHKESQLIKELMRLDTVVGKQTPYSIVAIPGVSKTGFFEITFSMFPFFRQGN